MIFTGRSITTVCFGALSTTNMPEDAAPVAIIAAKIEIIDVNIELGGSIQCATIAKHVRRVEIIPEIP